MLAANTSGQVKFARTDYRTGTQPASVIAADFNGDGKLDLAVANEGSNTVSILLGKGDGTFGAKADFGTGSAPISVVAGDFNGDGKLDLAIANHDSNTVSILLGKGDGTFGAKTDFATGSAPVSLVAGDFNGDEKLDLAVANKGSDTVSILLGKGDGTFGPKTDFLTASMPSSVTTGDFNGDGKLDLAVANSMPGTVSILLGKGDGTFGPKADFITGLKPLSVTTADFNKDHKLDVVTANSSSNTASVLLGRGDGTFDPKTDLGTDTGPLSVTAPDFNSDGNPDLITSNFGHMSFYYGYGYLYPTISLLLGNGNGTFGPRTDFFTGQNPVSVTTGDFNADGNLDLATANRDGNSVSVLLRDPVVPSPESLNFGNQRVGTSSAEKTVTVTHGGNPGSASFTIQSVTLAGANPGDFSRTADTCSGTTLAPGSSCVVSVKFTPAALGSRMAEISIADNAPGNPHKVPLSGAGIPLVGLSPSSLAFGPQLIGITSAPQTVTLTNNGSSALAITSITSSGDFAQTNTCGSLVAAGGNCTIRVTFTPTAAGARTGAMTITDSAPGSPRTVPLTGTGTTDFSISASPGTATATAGQSATYTLTITPTPVGGFNQTVSLTCSGAPTAATCLISPASVTLNGSTASTATVTVTTTARAVVLPGPRVFPPSLSVRVLLLWLLLLLAFAMLASLLGANQRRVWMGFGTAMLFAMLCLACGGGGGGGAPQGTPAGTYTITLTGNSGSLIHSTTVSLIVN